MPENHKGHLIKDTVLAALDGEQQPPGDSLTRDKPKSVVIRVAGK